MLSSAFLCSWVSASDRPKGITIAIMRRPFDQRQSRGVDTPWTIVGHRGVDWALWVGAAQRRNSMQRRPVSFAVAVLALGLALMSSRPAAAQSPAASPEALAAAS